jgi:hypothetical protein
VARGFADVGYEEFALLPHAKLVSLFTGQLSDLRDDDRRFFFVVPTPDMILQEVDRAGWDVVTVEHRDRRVWFVELVAAASARRVTGSGPTLLESLLAALIEMRHSVEE